MLKFLSNTSSPDTNINSANTYTTATHLPFIAGICCYASRHSSSDHVQRDHDDAEENSREHLPHREREQ